MTTFFDIYKDTIELFEEETFENEVWRNNLINNLLMLNKNWPNIEIEEIADDLNDWPWRVEQVKKWSDLDIKTLEQELYRHGSLFFLDVKQHLSEEEESAILENFWELSSKVENPKSSAIFTLTAGKLKNVNKVEKIRKSKSELELITDELNKVKKHHWDLLFDYSKEWEIDDRLTQILKDLGKPKSRIKAKDRDFFIDTLKYLVEKNYIFRIEEANKSQINLKLTFNSIINALENA